MYGIIAAGCDTYGLDSISFCLKTYVLYILKAESIIQEFLYRNANRNGNSAVYCAYNRIQYFKRKATAIFKTAAVFVIAVIRMGREKSCKQVAMSKMNLNEIKACLYGSFGRDGKFLCHIR